MTVGEAAQLLGIHRNTVHNRVKVGSITAHKVVEGECEVYPIEWSRSALGAQVQILGPVREQLGAARVRREMAETTLRGRMAEEQRRREQAERERDHLCQELEAIIAARASPQTGEEQQRRVGPTALQ